MKRTLAAFTLIAAALTVGALAGTPARADGPAQVQIADGDRHGRHDRRDGRRWHHRDHDDWRRHRRHGHGHHRKHRGGGGIVLQFGAPPVHAPPPCRVVHRDGYFYGRYARIGETLCYDRYGQAYVAAGSQFLVHYY